MNQTIAKQFLGWRGKGVPGLATKNLRGKGKKNRLFITKKVYNKTIKNNLIHSNKNLKTMASKYGFKTLQ